MNKIILAISSVFGLGYIKYAPGTFGSLGGLLLWLLICPSIINEIFAIILITVISIIFSGLAEKIYQKKDDGRIVIDEVCGIWLSLAFLPREPFFLIAAFILFRFFDVKKPFFINRLQVIKGGYGITL
ncbi:MAG: phosphatidylglycerophosphatase A, partial [Elusimicrobiota bacterium]|nr:phosphatidylglycerophosphatase A [Elusimicrobiota bacterium]